MTIPQKLWALMGTACLTGIAAASLCLFQMHTAVARYDSILEHQVKAEADARVMQVTFKKEVQEWKDTLLRGNDPAQLAKYSGAFLKEQQAVRGQAVALLESSSGHSIHELVGRFLEAHDRMSERYGTALGAFKAAGGQNAHEADLMVKGQDRGPTNLIDDIVKGSETEANQLIQQNHRAVARQRTTCISVLAIAFTILLAGAAMTIRSLTVSLRRTITVLQGSVQEVTSSADQISSATQALADAASRQASLTEETSASSAEISAHARAASSNTVRMTEVMEQVSKRTAAGLGKMQDLTAAMQSIKQETSEIEKVLHAIDDIAFQTNILALNAAIEAARAGEAGLGFSVVADEVRQLAHRSAEAVQSTSQLITQCTESVRHGDERLADARQTIDGISGLVCEMKPLLESVQAASREQNRQLETIQTAMSQNESTAQTTAAGAEEGAAAGEELASMSGQLRQLMLDLQQLV